MQSEKRDTVIIVSVTELSQFSQCRRRWWLSRQHVTAIAGPKLWFGSAIHAGLEGYYKGGRTTEAAQLAYAAWVNASYDELEKAYGSLWPDAEIEYRGLVNIGSSMLSHYAVYDADAEYQFAPIAVEKRVYLPIPGTKDHLSARLDLLGREVHSGMVAVVDHKTSAGGHAQGRMLDLDEQLTGYSYTYWRATRGKLPDFVVYDVLKKKVPEAPRVLKNGELSRDKAQGTTFEMYLTAIREKGDDPTHEYYKDVLDALKARGWSDFFEREVSYRNLEQVTAYERRVKIVLAEMRRVIADPTLAYPNPQPILCNGCPFLAVCLQMEDGSDYEHTLKTAYVPGNMYEANRLRKDPS